MAEGQSGRGAEEQSSRGGEEQSGRGAEEQRGRGAEEQRRKEIKMFLYEHKHNNFVKAEQDRSKS